MHSARATLGHPLLAIRERITVESAEITGTSSSRPLLYQRVELLQSVKVPVNGPEREGDREQVHLEHHSILSMESFCH